MDFLSNNWHSKVYFTGSKTFWKNFEMWKFWSFLKMPKILQSMKLCWGVWRSDIFPPTKNIKNTKETDHFAPRFSFFFIRPIFHKICPFFLRVWNRKTSRISKTFYRKTVARIRVVFWSISLPSSKIIFKRGADQLFSYPLVKFPCFQML